MKMPSLMIVILALCVCLGGCTKVKELVGQETSNAATPTELTEFEPSIDVETLWSKRIGKGADEHYLKLTPVIINDLLFVADRHGHLAATAADSGKVVWEIEDESVQYTGGPGGGDGLVLIGTGDGRVIAREADSGKLRWVAKVSSEVLAAPRASNGVTVVRTGDGKLFGLNSQTGAESWVYDRTVPTLTLRGIGAPVIDGDIVLAGFDNGRFAAINLTTGKLVWDTALAVPSGRSDLERMVDVDAEPVIVDGTVYVASFQGGVAAIAVSDGQILWTRDISSYDEITVGDGRVYVTDEEGKVWALNRETGASLWKQDGLTNRFVTGPTYIDKHIVVGDFAGYVHWLNAENGEFEYRTQIDEMRIIAPPINAGGQLLTYNAEGFLVSMRPK